MSTHQLKTHSTWFARVIAGEKTAEIRKHDRDFQAGDLLDLIETWETEGRHYDPERECHAWHRAGDETGRCETALVTHVLPAAQFPQGLQGGYCLLSIRVLGEDDPR